MGIGQIVMVLVVLAVGGAYWWFKVGRRGGTSGYIKNQLGLREGEEIASMWTCYFDIDKSAGEKVGEVFGVHTRGKNIFAALTNAGRLTIGDNEGSNPPMGFEPGEVALSLSDKKAEIKTIAGQNGMEKAVVVQVQPVNGTPFRLQIAQSGFNALQAWADNAA